MLAIQKCLLDGTLTIGSLATNYAITAKRHPLYPELVHFKYNQIESPFSEQIVRECRGIILNEKDNWSVVSRAFDKFFNYDEGHAAEIDWSTARVQEKVDGSLCVVYRYDDKWHVATTGTPDGSGRVGASNRTFAEYFWEAFRAHGGVLPTWGPGFANGYCYFFELCGPDNRVVIPHAEVKLYALGARALRKGLGYQLDSDDASFFTKVRAVRSFQLQSFEDITASFASMSPLAQEGYVVCDAQFNRVKVKHPGYVALHHAKDGLTEKAFIEIARSGEVCEVLTAFPEFKPLLEATKVKVDAFIEKLESDYLAIKHIKGQKDFALEAVKATCPAALFTVRAGKAPSIRGFVSEMRLDNLREYLRNE